MSVTTLTPKDAHRTTSTADAPAKTPPRTGRRPRTPHFSRAAVNTVLVVMSFYTLMPILWLLFAATKDNGDLFGKPGFQLGDFSLLSNLSDLFTYQDGVFGRWLANSALYSLVGSLVSTMLCVAAGYAFDKYHFAGKERIYGFVLLGLLVPATVVSLPIYLLASEVNLVNTYWAVLIPSLANPFGVYLSRVFSEGYVPDETLEAARMDGAGEIRTFASIALPMLKPAFMTVFLFSFTGSWNSFFLPLVMLNDQDLYPVGLGLFNWNANLSQYPEQYALLITGSLVSILPLVLAFLCLQRYWRSGLTAGAVK
ncbi:ABC transporter permease subunit [Streptomyces sp. SID4919]|uniref:carbohydrate ABC transporter permease n=1 Tax=unclassified Streptomyces TaxID=2593676 RepID=UPI000C07974C|nr:MULTISPECIES: carbohydrate ABC transporter permease [unclassified Streptomyces]MYY08153.1 ABC transporter permease subunit [Streptomyces sp. SID4919]